MMTNEHGQTFGQWLVSQTDHEGVMGELVAAAKSDRTFPRDGDPEAVRKHLSKMQVDGDFFDAVDDAEADWMRY